MQCCFQEEGAELHLVGRSSDRLAEVQKDAQAFGDAGVHIIEGDLEDNKTVDSIANKVKGKVNILVNNAGMLDKEPILEGNPDRWEKVVRLDLLVSMRLTRLIGPEMAKRGHGNIINISSVAGLEPMKGFAVYCATKFGLTGFTLSAFEELRDMGIHVTGIFPGYVATAMTTEAKVPQEKMIQPEDIAEAAMLPFRLSDRAVPTQIVVRPSQKVE
ncbi:g6344 [Coccomyxa viridis]|uniref:G6344 protein n=1 Tax=Coccomyxa viridis TaxID=1274662 RepID=A0ABP1FV65_9CHLO